MSYILFNNIFSDTLSCLFIFTIMFHIRIHLTPETNKFHNMHASCFIFKFANNFFILHTIFGVITIVK